MSDLDQYRLPDDKDHWHKWLVVPATYSPGKFTVRKESHGGSISHGLYDTIEDGEEEIRRMRRDGGTCYVCGEPIESNRNDLKDGMCGTCTFWHENVDLVDDPRMVRINYHHYYIGPKEQGGGRWSGYGGRRFDIIFNDGREVTTNNLWSQGRIPLRFRPLLPNNARWKDDNDE